MLYFLPTSKNLITSVCLSVLLLCNTIFNVSYAVDPQFEDNTPLISNPNYKFPNDDFTSIITSIKNNDLAEIRRLMEQTNFNLNLRNKNGTTILLMYAIFYGNTYVIKELVKVNNFNAYYTR